MKALIIILLISTTSFAQVVNIHFVRLKNEEVKASISNNINRFTKALRNFDATDSIYIYYNVDLKRDYILVKSNITDTNKIYFVYLNFIAFCATQKYIAAWERMNDLKIYVRYGNDKYLYADYEYLQINDKPITIPDKKFK